MTMNWFRKSLQVKKVPTKTKDHDNRVEVIAHKTATEESIKRANKANEALNHLLEVENHITIKIFLAAGGHLPIKRKKA